MLEHFMEWLLGPQGKAIVLAVWAIGTLITAIVAWLEHHRRKVQDTKVAELQSKLAEEGKHLDAQKTDIQLRDREIASREKKLHMLRSAVLGSEDELWRLHDPRPFSAYPDWIAGRRPIVVTVANLKGGVGKTTLTTSLAAYFDAEARKRVLVLDMDYQGSPSNMMLSASGETEVESRINCILDGRAVATEYQSIAVHLGPSLPNTWVIPAYYPLAPLESRLMVEWLMQESDDDVRYRLAQFLAHKSIRDNFDIVFIDVPPRLTTGTINAICASTYLLVPTVMDRTSAEAVGTFLSAARQLKAKLNPGLELLGVVGTLTHQQNKLHESEERAKVRIEEQLPRVWGPNQVIFERHIPRKMEISRAAGEGIAYLNGNGEVRAWMNTLGGAIKERIGL